MKTKEIKVLLSLSVMVFGCNSRNMEKETWLVPCNYTGTLTVYFNAKTTLQQNNRVYKFNNRGISYSSLSTNDGFTPDFNQTLSIESDCDINKKEILYYDGADSAKVKPGEIYATYFLIGKDSLYFESILIKRKSK